MKQFAKNLCLIAVAGALAVSCCLTGCFGDSSLFQIEPAVLPSAGPRPDTTGLTPATLVERGFVVTEWACGEHQFAALANNAGSYVILYATIDDAQKEQLLQAVYFKLRPNVDDFYDVISSLKYYAFEDISDMAPTAADLEFYKGMTLGQVVPLGFEIWETTALASKSLSIEYANRGFRYIFIIEPYELDSNLYAVPLEELRSLVISDVEFGGADITYFFATNYMGISWVHGSL